MAAYVLARYESSATGVYFFFVSGLTFPVFLALVPLFKIRAEHGPARHLPGSDPGVRGLLAAVHDLLPHRVLKTLPSTVAEAAFIDGCGHVRTFFQIMLPMAKPGLISITIST